MSPGATNAGSSTSNDRTARRQRVRPRRARSRGRRRAASFQARTHSWSSHSPPTLRRKRMRPSTPPSFVKFAARASSVRIGSSSSSADERPRPARHVREAAMRRGHRDDGRGGVVRADRRDDRRPGESDCRAHLGSERAADRAGRLDRRKQACGDVDRVEQRGGPVARADVDEAGRRRVRVLGAQLAGEPEREEVGEQHDVRDVVPNGRRAARPRAGRSC